MRCRPYFTYLNSIVKAITIIPPMDKHEAKTNNQIPLPSIFIFPRAFSNTSSKIAMEIRLNSKIGSRNVLSLSFKMSSATKITSTARRPALHWRIKSRSLSKLMFMGGGRVSSFSVNGLYVMVVVEAFLRRRAVIFVFLVLVIIFQAFFFNWCLKFFNF
jgi:hypothetical protein